MALDFSLKGTSFEKKEEPSTPTLDFSLKGTSFNKEPNLEKDSTSGIEAGITGFVKELIPSTGAFAAGTRAGIAAAAATPPVLPVIGPLAKPVVGGTVGLVAGLLAAFGLSEGQEAVLEKVAPETLAKARQAEKEHPYAYHAGSLASVVPSSGLGIKALKELADIEIKKGTKLGMGKATVGVAGLGAGFETGMELATTGGVDPVKVAMSAAAFPVTIGNTKIGGKLAGIKEPIPSPAPEPTLTKPTESLGEVVTPQEGGATPEGISTPQEGVETRLKALDKELEYFNNPPKDYHPKDAVETINKANKELKTETDEDVRVMLRIVRDRAKQVLEGDLHPVVVAETGLDIRRNGNYIDVVEVPEKLQRQGIGTKIVENLETDMKAEGHKSAFLLAKEDSIPFWEKQGYQVAPSHVREKGENVPMSKKLSEDGVSDKISLATTITEGLIKEADGTPATTDAGLPRIARRNKETGEIELNPEAVKASWEASTPENKPWIKETFSTPEQYKEFIVKHEEEHAASPQKEGETTLDYEKRITKQALEKLGISRGEEVKPPSIYEVLDETDFQNKGKEVLRTQGPEAAKQFAEDYQNYRRENYVNLPKTDPSNPMNEHPMADALYNIDTLHRKDEAELRLLVQEEPEGVVGKTLQKAIGGERTPTLAEQGITKEVREKWARALDGEVKLTPEETAQMESILRPMRTEAEALARKTGEPLEEGYQPRIRLWTPKSLKETFGRWWEDMTRTEGAFAQKMAETPDALKERNLFVVESPKGRRTVIQIRSDGVYAYKNGKSYKYADLPKEGLKAGDTLGTDGIIKTAKISELEKDTPYRYSKDPVLNWKIRLNELRKLDREQTFLRELTSNPSFKDIGMDVLDKETGKPNELPVGWKVPKNIDRIPQLAGKAFEPKIAYILEDWAKGWDKSMMQNLTSFLIKNMMLNPLPHVFNEAMHLYNIRGATGWFTPGGVYRFTKTASQGMRDVFNQTPLYLQVMKEGGSLLGADPRNKQFVRDVLAKATKDALKDPNFQQDLGTIAVKVGMKPLDLYNRWSQASNKFMWTTRDMMYMQVIRETMNRRNVGVKEAIKIVEKHMPNYRLPSKIMGSRKVSEVLGNPNVAVFSRYHYGMVRSILETLKEADPRNLRTPEGKQKFLHAADVMAAVGIAYAGLYPIMDMMAKEMFEMESEQRRAGPYHLIHALKEVKEGKKDVQTAIAPVFTFNPVLLYGGQLALNRQVYSGKEVYHPNDSAEMIFSDVGNYTLKTIPQYGPMQQAEESPEGLKKFIAKQMDIKAKTTKEERKRKVHAKNVELARKRREKAYRLGE